MGKIGVSGFGASDLRPGYGGMECGFLSFGLGFLGFRVSDLGFSVFGPRVWARRLGICVEV